MINLYMDARGRSPNLENSVRRSDRDTAAAAALLSLTTLNGPSATMC